MWFSFFRYFFLSFTCFPLLSVSFQHDGKRCLEGFFFSVCLAHALHNLRRSIAMTSVFLLSLTRWRRAAFPRSMNQRCKSPRKRFCQRRLPVSFSFLGCVFHSFSFVPLLPVSFQRDGERYQEGVFYLCLFDACIRQSIAFFQACRFPTGMFGILWR